MAWPIDSIPGWFANSPHLPTCEDFAINVYILSSMIWLVSLLIIADIIRDARMLRKQVKKGDGNE